MRHKKQSGIYLVLEKNGLLEHGSTEEIVVAKKLYWVNVRKTWKQAYRKEYKSYTISFSNKEQRLLRIAGDKTRTSINSVIKNACMSALAGEQHVDKKTAGAIRELLIHFQNDLQSVFDTTRHPEAFAKMILNKFATLENNILSLLHKKENNAF